MKVIYHKNCPDGFTAAWAAWMKLGAQAEYIAASYGDAAPVVNAGETVYILDFSYPRPTLDAMSAFADVRVIDHHKTAQEDLAGFPNAIFDMDHSGAALAWQHFHGASPVALVKYVEDRDLWRFQLPHSREISAWFFSYDYDFAVWSGLQSKLATDFHQVAAEGQAILRARMRDVRAMADQARLTTFCDEEFRGIPITNASVHMSDVAEELQRRNPLAAFTAYYFDRGDGKQQYGLRSRGEFDVSAVARRFGGGGHRNAAGFVVDAQ